MKSQKANFAVMITGLLFLAAGLYLIRTTGDPQGLLRVLPYLCIGVGSGLFGHGMGEIVSARAMKSDPELRRKLEIERKDERNIAIANRAKGKAFDMMTYVFSALMLAFALMEVDLAPLLLLVFAYLFVHGTAVYYRIRFDREM
jgi:hypothetical protein